jgi:subtilisin family serine protease
MSFDSALRKLHPRLRCIRNGSAPVNILRSEFSATVATPKSVDVSTFGVPLNLDLSTFGRPVALEVGGGALERSGRLPKRLRMAQQPKPDRSFVNVFVELHRDCGAETGTVERAALDRIADLIARSQNASGVAVSAPGSQVLTRRNVVAATVPVTAFDQLMQDPDVAFVHAADPLTFDKPAMARAPSGPPTPRRVGKAGQRKAHGDGEGVIIGVIDVGGFDFSHPEFRDGVNGTRFLSIWDQGGDFRAPPAERGLKRFDYGSELTKPLMDAAISGALAGALPAHFVERQSQRSEGSHATHVASIAAGSTGVCPKAMIAAVLISVPRLDDDIDEKRATFTDSMRIVHAVEYLLEIAEREKMPISINISLGTNGGGHDGSNSVSRWIDALLSAPGRSVCVAAGNAGQEKGVTSEDVGFVMGRIHSSGRIASRGLSADLEWNVIGNGIEDMSENELEVWYGAQDRLTIMLRPPGGDWITVKPREYVENRRLSSGTTVSLYNELYHPTNGANYAAIYLSPNLDPKALRGVQSGVWTVRLVGDEIRDGRFNCWIERDDPIAIGVGGGARYYRFPSFFSEASNVDSHAISSLACGHRVIAVANLDDARQRINISSSQGPTRDNRSKPDIAAPGTDIVAAKGFSNDGDAWISMTGTSMASPFVAGVVGLMLAVNPRLTSAQVSGILQRTARPLPGATYEWRNDAGFGVIDPAAAIEEARSFHQRVEVRS